MRINKRTGFALCLLLSLAAALFWQLAKQPAEHRASHEQTPLAAKKIQAKHAKTAPTLLPVSGGASQGSLAKTNAPARAPLSYRVSNTTQTLKQLQQNDRAVLLRNALIDTTQPLDLAIPEKFRSKGDPEAYVVQSCRALDERFYAGLKAAGVTFVSYIPNNAALVSGTANAVQQLRNSACVTAVLPYEPYYRIPLGLLAKKDLPQGTMFAVTAFPNKRAEALEMITKGLQKEIKGEDRTPFGDQFIVEGDSDTLVAMAQSSAIQQVEPFNRRALLNDLTRARLHVSPNTVSPLDYLDLTGSNVTVAINDSGVDASHPDLAGRVLGVATNDYDGHGTHVAGIMISTGSNGPVVSAANPIPGSVNGASFRGKAPNAKLFTQPIDLITGPLISDAFLQENAKTNGAFIANNSWGYIQIYDYSMASASYDAATRDSVPGTTGSQPMLFVFAAGNDGGSDTDGLTGFSDSIVSPGNAKNVITVGAVESRRRITNEWVDADGDTNSFFNETSSSTEVAYFSSRGNTGIGIEGDFGRFKPDVMAPGVFIVSCRMTNWIDPTNGPTYKLDHYPDQRILSGDTNLYQADLEADTAALIIRVTPNAFSPNPLPNMPIYVEKNVNPPTIFRGDTEVTLTNNISGGSWFIGIKNTNSTAIDCDVDIYRVETNAMGNYFQILSNLNSKLMPYYRYESGTSMAAPAVSGVLALMQEYFATHLGNTNPSPALMKALLINGSRSLSSLYDYQVNREDANHQGWGIVSISNSIPTATVTSNSGPVQFFDQAVTNALATGDSTTRKFTVDPSAKSFPLRITLVWTDPPGNPSASTKLVNDLDLIVTNLDTGEIYLGNNFESGSTFSSTNEDLSGSDTVNNVENVFLDGRFIPLGGNYSITVRGKRVNVNAVTQHPDQIAQDYALVISSGNTASATPFTLTQTDNDVRVSKLVSIATNGLPLLNQRVGANSPLLGDSNGTLEQWHFFIYTNTAAVTNANYTNVVLVTFFPPDLGRPRLTDADIDLYASQNPDLLILDPAAVAGSLKSTNRGGSETIFFTDSGPNEVYYVGVKSEDQQAAEFGFLAIATDKPLDQTDGNGMIPSVVVSTPMPIPDGSLEDPRSTKPPIICIPMTTGKKVIRNVVVTNTVGHQMIGDLVGVLAHSAGRTKKVTLQDQHSAISSTNHTFVFDDLDEDPSDGSIRSDGPGSMRDFIGDRISGAWTFTMTDKATNHIGQIEFFDIRVDPKPDTNNFIRTIAGNGWYYDYVDVPSDATNLSINVVYQTGSGSVDIYARKGDFPDPPRFDYSTNVTAPGGALTISTNSSPPLSGGRYYYGIHNNSGSAITIQIIILIGRSLVPDLTEIYSGGGNGITDDAVTKSQILVTNIGQVVGVDVGVRINHPRASDLVLYLISPEGTRVMLAEARGGTSTGGYGVSITTTNVVPRESTGGPEEDRNIIDAGQTTGTLIVDYDFYSVPDQMRIYYEGNLVKDTGLVSGQGTVTYNFNGSSSQLTIVMNEGGSSQTGTRWTYTARVVTEKVFYTYFTENTNLASQLIKFAPPPFAGTNNVFTNRIVLSNGFEGIPAGTYSNLSIGTLAVLTNEVEIITDTNLAYAGTNLLALANGHLGVTLPTEAGRAYLLSYAFRGANITDWWPADGKANDLIGTNTGTLTNMTFLDGEVGKTFHFNGSNSVVSLGKTAGNFGTNDFTIEFWLKTASQSSVQALIEKRSICNATSQIDLRIGGAGAGAGPGQLKFVTMSDNVGNNFSVMSGNKKINDGIWHHIALLRKTTNLAFYIDGTLDTNIVTTSGIANISNNVNLTIGKSVCTGSDPTVPLNGDVDELDLFNRALSPAEIRAIYFAGASGKYASSTVLPNAQILINGQTNSIVDNSAFWQTERVGFIATTNSTFIELDGSPLGILFDDFVFSELPSTNFGNYYFPEESLSTFIGENAYGYWTLEIWDTRAGAAVSPQLIDWKLQVTVSSTNVNLIVLTNGLVYSNNLAPGAIQYFAFDVPLDASYATNIGTSLTGGELDLFFNQNALPTGTLPGDVTLLSFVTSGTYVLSKNGTPPFLQPGQRYFLGLKNRTLVAQDYNIEVVTDVNPIPVITPLTNGVSLSTNVLATTNLQYYYFDVSTDAILAAFEILNPSGDVDLILKHSLPVPDRLDFDYISSNSETNDEAIIITTNSAPVALTSGRWYLAVYNNYATNAITYTIRATEIIASNGPVIIPLTDGVAYTDTNQPGAAFNTFYSFTITTGDPAVEFIVTNMDGNVDLLVRKDAFPSPQLSDRGSFNTGTTAERIVMATNAALPSLNGTWYLGVPNNATGPVIFDVRATLGSSGTNFPLAAFKIRSVSFSNGTNGFTFSWNGERNKQYEIGISTNLANWSVLTNVTAASSTPSYTDPTPIQSAPRRYYRLRQLP